MRSWPTWGNLVLGLTLCCFGAPAAGQQRPGPAPDPERLDDRGRLWAGHRALVEDRYDEALRYYTTAERRGTGFAGIRVLIEAVEHRRGLGRPAPADTHRIGAVYVTAVRRIGRDGREALQPDITSQQMEEWGIYLGVLRRVIEAFSDGGWTLAVDEREAVATVHEGDSLRPANPDHLGLGRFFFEQADRYDTFITFSKTNSPSYGLARRYPLIEGVLYGPHRGMVETSDPSFLTLIHEFFHVVEWASGAIAPAHGFDADQRRHFPGWTGESELDYYRWHFRETLPRVGWRRLDHRTRWRLAAGGSREAWERINAAYKNIPLAARQEARGLAVQAQRLARIDTTRARALLEQALERSPYAPEALEPLIALHRAQGRAAEVVTLEARLREARAVAAVEEAEGQRPPD